MPHLMLGELLVESGPQDHILTVPLSIKESSNSRAITRYHKYFHIKCLLHCECDKIGCEALQSDQSEVPRAPRGLFGRSHTLRCGDGLSVGSQEQNDTSDEAKDHRARSLPRWFADGALLSSKMTSV